MTSECEGKISQFSNNQDSNDTLAALHDADVDIFLDGESGQSLRNDNYGTENVPSSLLNALLPDIELQNTSQSLEGNESPNLVSNKNSRNECDNLPVEQEPERESPSSDIHNARSENQTHETTEKSDVSIKLDAEKESQSNETQENNDSFTEENRENEAATQRGMDQTELSGEEKAVNQLLEALNTSNDKSSAIDSEHKIDINIDLDSSVEQKTDELNESVDNNFGKSLPSGMISVLDALDPNTNNENENKLESEIKEETEFNAGMPKNKDIIDNISFKLECDESNLIKPYMKPNDKEENKTNDSEKITEDVETFGENISAVNQVAEPAEICENSFDNADEITLEDILEAKKPKIEDESDFEVITFKSTPSSVNTEKEIKKDEIKLETDNTDSLVVQSQSCSAGELKIQIVPKENTTEESEWNQIDTVEVAEQSSLDESEITSRLASTTIKYKDAERECRTLNWRQYAEKVKTTNNKKGFFATIKNLFCGPPNLNKDLEDDRLFVFCMAAYPFDNSCQMHICVLQTIFKLLTGSRFDCSRYGNHWENIGFQGTDPSTDLRGTGFLGLLQILYLMTSHSNLGQKIYKLSLHETQNFPFCVMSINITRSCLQILREGLLNKDNNARKLVLPVFNRLYAGAFNEFYTIWKKGGKTITDTGFVLKDLETNLRKQKDRIMSQIHASPNLEEDDRQLDFFDVCAKDN